jgi:hypothetical protein
MRRPTVLLVALALGVGAALLASGALAHQSGCHSQHTCPSDHHTYVWYDSNGQGWDCAEPGASEYDPSRDTTTIVYAGLTYYCRPYGSPTTTTPPPTQTQPPATTQPTETTPAPEPADCVYRHSRELPDRYCTPGKVFSTVRARQVCRSGYSKGVRHVTTFTKNAVYASYGVLSHTAGEYEVDHLVPLELGGSNAIENLWPEPADTDNGEDFHTKDRLENFLHKRVCSGRMSLRAAQRAMKTNWITAAIRYGLD